MATLKPRTDYRGPTVSRTYQFAETRVILEHPGEPDRMLDDPEVAALNLADDYMPYWAYLWPGAHLLANALASGLVAPAGKRVLEIGCGLGLVGLTAMKFGGRVCFSDYDEAPLEFVSRSLELNGLSGSPHSLRRMDWREPPDERYEIVLGADVLYESRLVPLVAGLIDRTLEADGVAVLSDPYRKAAEHFEETAGRLGLVSTSIEAEVETETLGRLRGTIRIVRRASAFSV